MSYGSQCIERQTEGNLRLEQLETGVYRKLSRRNVVPKLPSPAHTPGDSLHPLISKDTKGLFSEHVRETRETRTEIILVYLGIKDYISICSPLLLSQSKNCCKESFSSQTADEAIVTCSKDSR